MKTIFMTHCSDTTPDMAVSIADIRRWHVEENGWSDIGYNWVIDRDGTLIGGRDIDNDGDFSEETGAHARGFNKTAIGVCLIGGRGRNGKPEANFTLEQYIVLRDLYRKECKRFGPLEIKGHRDVSSKDCPSFNVQALLTNEVV